MDPTVPKPKPLTAEEFKFNADRYIKGALGGFDRGEMVDFIQRDLRKIQESGTMEYDDAINFIKERTQELKDFIKQNPGETLPALPGFEDREEFKDGPPKTSPVKTEIYKYPVSNRFGTFYAMEPRGNQYTKKSGVSLQTDEYKNKIAKEIKDNFLRYNDVKKEYGRKTADLFKGQYPNVGKIPSDEGKQKAKIKRDNWVKANSSVSMLQKISGDKGRGNLQLSHLYSKNVPDSLKTLGYLPSDVNIKSYSKFEKPLTTAINKVYSELDKKKTNAKALLAAFKQYQTEDRKLRAQFPEYKDTKSRLSFKRTGFDPSGIMIQEKLINPKLAISKEAGTQLKGVMPSSPKGQGIISLANLAKDKIKNLIKVKGVGGGTQELYKDPLGGPDLIRVRDIIRND